MSRKPNLPHNPDTSSITSLIHELSGGNPGALNVLCQVMVSCEPLETAVIFEGLKHLDLKGPEIWGIYKDTCECDLARFTETVIDMTRTSLLP